MLEVVFRKIISTNRHNFYDYLSVIAKSVKLTVGYKQTKPTSSHDFNVATTTRLEVVEKRLHNLMFIKHRFDLFSLVNTNRGRQQIIGVCFWLPALANTLTSAFIFAGLCLDRDGNQSKCTLYNTNKRHIILEWPK